MKEFIAISGKSSMEFKAETDEEAVKEGLAYRANCEVYQTTRGEPSRLVVQIRNGKVT